MKKSEIKLISILIAITVIVVIILVVRNNNNDDNKSTKVQTDLIDVNDEAYTGKKIYEKDGDIIIEGENGSKTIETTKGENTDLKQLSGDERNQYTISDVKVDIQGNRTTIKGNVKNNTKSKHKINVQIKFYDNNNRAKGSSSTVLENVGSGETKAFEMYVMGNMAGYTYKIEVTYTD